LRLDCGNPFIQPISINFGMQLTFKETMLCSRALQNVLEKDQMTQVQNLLEKMGGKEPVGKLGSSGCNRAVTMKLAIQVRRRDASDQQN